MRARRTASAAAGAGHHQAGGVQDAGAVGALDRLVDRLGEAEIVGRCTGSRQDLRTAQLVMCGNAASFASGNHLPRTR